MKKSELETEELSATLLELVQRDLSAKEMLKEMQKKHPKASKKKIVLAAFAAMIAAAASDPQTAKRLHGFAVVSRTPT